MASRCRDRGTGMLCDSPESRTKDAPLENVRHVVSVSWTPDDLVRCKEELGRNRG